MSAAEVLIQTQETWRMESRSISKRISEFLVLHLISACDGGDGVEIE